MHVLMVHIQVKPEYLDDFLAAMRNNASNSLLEPGVVRFDILQQKDDPTRITLVEVYRQQEDHAKHRETAHYKRWYAAVGDMMAAPRSAVTYTNVFPEDADW